MWRTARVERRHDLPGIEIRQFGDLIYAGLLAIAVHLIEQLHRSIEDRKVPACPRILHKRWCYGVVITSAGAEGGGESRPGFPGSGCGEDREQLVSRIL